MFLKARFSLYTNKLWFKIFIKTLNFRFSNNIQTEQLYEVHFFTAVVEFVFSIYFNLFPIQDRREFGSYHRMRIENRSIEYSFFISFDIIFQGFLPLWVIKYELASKFNFQLEISIKLISIWFVGLPFSFFSVVFVCMFFFALDSDSWLAAVWNVGCPTLY